jgi:hypothetical protein
MSEVTIPHSTEGHLTRGSPATDPDVHQHERPYSPHA